MSKASNNPIAWEAGNWPWQYFITLTFSDSLVGASEIRKFKILFAYLRDLAQRLPVTGKSGQILSNRKSFPALEFIAASEHGEKTGRYHLHVLLAGLHPSCLSKSTTFFIKNRWETVTGGSHARVWRYDSSLPGVSYTLKSLDGFDKNEAISYELNKFGEGERNETVMLAHVLIERWSRRRRNKRNEGTSTATVCGSRGKNRHGKRKGTGLISDYSLSSSNRRPA